MEFPTQITDQFDNAAKAVVDTNERVLDTVISVNRRVVDNAVETVDRLPSVELPLADKRKIQRERRRTRRKEE